MNHTSLKLCTVLSLLLLTSAMSLKPAVGQTDYSEDLATVRSQIKQTEDETVELTTERSRLAKKLSEISQEIASLEQNQRNVNDTLSNQDLTEQDSTRAKYLQELEFEQRTEALQTTMPALLGFARQDNLTTAIRNNDVNRLARSRAYLQYLARSQSNRIEKLHDSIENGVSDSSDTAKLALSSADLKQQVANKNSTRQSINQRLESLDRKHTAQLEKMSNLQLKEEELVSQQIAASKSESALAIDTTNLKFNPPIEAPIKRKFKSASANRWSGMLYQAKSGQDVKATAAGIVIYAKEHKNLGNLIIIDHGNRIFTLYGHNSKFEVKIGDLVVARQTIALAGKSGDVDKPSLYFEVRENGESVDPLQWIDG